MRAVARFDAYQRRHRWVGLPLAVVYKFFDDQATYLAALLAYYAFLSLFPIMLILVAVLGTLLSHNPGLQQDVLDSALGEFPSSATRSPRTSTPSTATDSPSPPVSPAASTAPSGSPRAHSTR